MPGKLKVLFVSSEVSPYSKSGGLGDVAGSLPAALRAMDVDARVVFPKYKIVNKELMKDLKYENSFTVTLSWRKQSASIFSFSGDAPAYMIENDYYFGRDGLYGYGDDYERFAFFSKAAVEFLMKVDFRPDIIHYNDWQTGLCGVYLNDVYKGLTFYSDIKSVYTIHNLQYQGVFGREILWAVDLNDGYFTNGSLEFNGKVSYMKAGIVFSDAVSTVSTTYANEIRSGLFDYGMSGVLCSRGNRMFGILNGIDTANYNPSKDGRIWHNYSDLAGKRQNKRKLQERLGLPQADVPVIAVISRLVDQKGLDLMAVAMEELLSMDIQIVILGTGDGRYENLFRHYAWRAPQKISASILFDADLAQQIYAGSDIFLMPSLFEPCGLGQMLAMRYGAVPVVRMTGGLSDTVVHYDPSRRTGNGFLFKDYVASGMMWALKEAIRYYYEPGEWAKIVKNCMNSDFSWEKSAGEYVGMYREILKDR